MADLLRQRIERDGPIGVDDFMALALGHPEYGYYMRREPFGRAGDFVTAPETSQMFGELIGLWCADCWQRIGAPASCLLVELGPGRGSLMADALRATAALPAAASAFEVHLVETSRRLRGVQRATLADREVTWHDRLDSVPRGRPALIIANEFFDALPVRQFVATARGWRERLIDVQDATFAPVLADHEPPADEGLPDLAPPGRVVEVSEAGHEVMADLARCVAQDGGAALIVDFAGSGDTLQAVRGHRRAERFADPGEADLAAAVDFAALAEVARTQGANAHGPVAQGTFLRALGIEQRCETLLRRADADQAAGLRAALTRLAGPDAMGELYRALAVCQPGMPTPAGFEAAP